MGYSRPLALWMVSRWTTSPSSSTCDSCSPAASPASAAQARNAPRPPPPAPENARARSTSFSRLAIAWAPPGPVAARNSDARASRTSSAASSCGSLAARRSCSSRSVASAAPTAACACRLRGEQVEPPAGGPEQEQLVVAEAEERRVQRPVHGRPVAGIVDGAQAQQRVVDLAAREVRLAAVDAVRHAGLAERLLVGLETGRGPEQQRDVAPAGRAPRLAARRRGARRAVLHGPALLLVAVHREQQRGERLRLVLPRRLGRAGGAAVVVAEQHRDPRSVGRRAERLDPLVARLPALLRVEVEHVGEHVVDPLHHRRGGAEVLADDLRRPGRRRLTRDEPLHLVVHADVGAPEAVDGLLGVADHEQLAGLEHHVAPVVRPGLALAEEEDDLRLQRVGVLELVDEQVAEARLQRRPGGAVADRAGRAGGREGR